MVRLWFLLVVVCGFPPASCVHVFRVFHTDKITPKVRELHVESSRMSGIPLSRHHLVVFNTHFANASLEKCNATDLYSALLPPAYQADLMRYCLLYLYGGLYIDLMVRLTSPSLHLFRYDLATVLDLPDNHMWTAIIAGRKGHPAFKDAIDMIRSNVENCRFTRNDLAVTGPKLWYDASVRYSPKILGRLSACREKYSGCGEVPGLLLNKMPGYKKEFSKMGYTPALKYGYMWSRGVIYPDRLCKLAHFASVFWL